MKGNKKKRRKEESLLKIFDNDNNIIYEHGIHDY